MARSPEVAEQAIRGLRQRPRLRRWDKVFRVLARRHRRHRGQHLIVIRPKTVFRWQRRG